MGVFWLVSYPKSGNTWLRLLLTNYCSCQDKPISINDIPTFSLTEDREYFDETLGLSSSDMLFDEIDYYRPRLYQQFLHAEEEPVFIKTHHAYLKNNSGESLFPQQVITGAIYLVRNPLDLVISYAHHSVNSIDDTIALMASDEHGFNLDPNRLFNKLHTNVLSWDHNASSWLDKPELNILAIRYEDLLANTKLTFSQILGFFGLEKNASRIDQAIKFSSFEQLRQQEEDNGFIEKQSTAKSFFREGKKDIWKQHLTKKQIKLIIENHRQTMDKFHYLDDIREYL